MRMTFLNYVNDLIDNPVVWLVSFCFMICVHTLYFRLLFLHNMTFLATLVNTVL